MAEEDRIRIYVTSISSNMKTKKNQLKITNVFDGKKIPYECIDISLSEESKLEMREKCGNDKALPPQLFKGDEYLGDFDAFDDAVETGTLSVFLRENLD